MRRGGNRAGSLWGIRVPPVTFQRKWHKPVLKLTRLWAILGKGLETTGSPWPEVRVAFGWIHRAATILANEEGLDVAGVRRRESCGWWPRRRPGSGRSRSPT